MESSSGGGRATGGGGGGGGRRASTDDDDQLIDMPAVASSDDGGQTRRRSITFEERRWLDDTAPSIPEAGSSEGPPGGGGGVSRHSSVSGFASAHSSGGASSFLSAGASGAGASGSGDASRNDDSDDSSRDSVEILRGLASGGGVTATGGGQGHDTMMGESMVVAASMGFAALGSSGGEGGGIGTGRGASHFGDSIMMGANDAGPAINDPYYMRGAEERQFHKNISGGIVMTNEDEAARAAEKQKQSLSGGVGGKQQMKQKKKSAWPRSKIFQSDDASATGGRDEVEDFADDLGASSSVNSDGSRGLGIGGGVGMSQRRALPSTSKGASWPRQDSEDDLAGFANDNNDDDLRHEEAMATAVKAGMRGRSLLAPLCLVGTYALQLFVAPFFFDPRAVGVAVSQEGVGIWRAVFDVYAPLLEGLSQVLILLLAVYLSLKKGSVFFLHLLRHSCYYLTLVGASYVIADSAYFHRYGNKKGSSSQFAPGGPYSDGAESERGARLGLTALMLLCAGVGLVSLERKGPAGKIRRMTRAKLTEAENGAAGGALAKADPSSDPNKDFAAAAAAAAASYSADLEAAAKGRRKFYALTRRCVSGYQLLAFLFVLRTTADYLIRRMDEGAWAMEYLRSSGSVLDKIATGAAASSVDSTLVEGSASGSSLLLLSLLRSNSAFLNLSLLLAVASSASLLPHSTDAVRLALLASLGRLLLSIGYAVNLATVVGGANNVDGFWSVGLTCLEMACSLGMVYGCACLSGSRSGKRKGGARTSADTKDAAVANSSTGIGEIGTLRSVAYSGSARTKQVKAARALHLSSVVTLVVHTAQALLMVGHDASRSASAPTSSSSTAAYDSHPAVDATKLGMHACLLYAAVNYASTWEGGRHYSGAVRWAVLTLGLAGTALCAWQLGALVVAATAGGGMEPLDATSVALSAIGTAAYLAVTFSAVALKDVRLGSNESSELQDPQAEAAMAAAAAVEARRSRSLRKTGRSLLRCFYLPTILAYSLCLAIYEGRDGAGADYSSSATDWAGYLGGTVNYPLVNRAPDAPEGLREFVMASTGGGGTSAAVAVPGVQGRRRLSWVYYDENQARHQADSASAASAGSYFDASAMSMGEAAYADAPFVVSDSTVVSASGGTVVGGVEEGGEYPRSGGRRVLAASLMSHVTPTLFLLAVNRPGLQSFFHYGLAFSAFAADGLRSRPTVGFSPHLAALLAAHGCLMLVGYVAGGLAFSTGLETDYAGEAVAAAPEDTGSSIWSEVGPGPRAEFLLTALWLTALAALAGVLVRLCLRTSKGGWRTRTTMTAVGRTSGGGGAEKSIQANLV